MITSDYDVIDYEAGADPELRGKECQGCRRLLLYHFYDKNSANRDGHDDLCPLCKKAPKLSISEHTSRLREMNYNSQGTRRQRHILQDDFKEAASKGGRPLECSVFLTKLLHIYPRLYVTQGGVTINGVVVDLALYATSPTKRPDWSGNDFRYMGYVTLGNLPEYSEYEFNERDILQKCTQIGWRSVLLRFIENGILTEEQCNKEFGYPSGGENSLWYKKLSNYRNAKKVA